MAKNTKVIAGRVIGGVGICLSLYFKFVNPLFENKTTNLYVDVFCWTLVAIRLYLMGIFPQSPFKRKGS